MAAETIISSGSVTGIAGISARLTGEILGVKLSQDHAFVAVPIRTASPGSGAFTVAAARIGSVGIAGFIMDIIPSVTIFGKFALSIDQSHIFIARRTLVGIRPDTSLASGVANREGCCTSVVGSKDCCRRAGDTVVAFNSKAGQAGRIARQALAFNQNVAIVTG